MANYVIYFYRQLPRFGRVFCFDFDAKFDRGSIVDCDLALVGRLHWKTKKLESGHDADGYRFFRALFFSPRRNKLSASIDFNDIDS